MRKNIFNYYFKFYFFAIIFFIQGIWIRIRNKKTQVVIAPEAEEGWIEEGEVKITPKPSQADAMANKAKFGWSNIPDKHKGKVIWGLIALVYFLLFGIVDSIIRLIQLIRAFHIIGWILGGGILTYILYRIMKSSYNYFNERKYHKFISEIKIIWAQAKQKSALKFIEK